MNKIMIFGIVIGLGGFALFFISIGLGFFTTVANPFYNAGSTYWHESKLDYPIYDPFPLAMFNKKFIYFDEYSISNDVVTVSGYWRLSGLTWTKCNGSLSFREDNFVPRKIETKRTTVEIISESCK